MISCLVCLVVGYLCGCLLTAELVAQRMAGASIFSLGDGNPGMANVGHELGTPAALLCLAGDILKTLLPVLVMHRLFGKLDWPVMVAWTGLGATLGHIYPFWHDFKGGKGVTTIASTIVLMQPILGAISGLVGVAVIVLAGYLSLGAVASIVFYELVLTLLHYPNDCLMACTIFVLLTCMAHWSKLRGIKEGTTRRASLSTKFWERVHSRRES